MAKVEDIRNVALAGHGGAGKTTLAEAMMYSAGAAKRLGRVEEGTTLSDYSEEEIKRGNSISVGVLQCEYGGKHFNVLDLPGYADFISDTLSGVRVSDAVVMVINAVSGIEVGTHTAYGYAEKYGIPRAFFINRMDRERADFDAAVKSIEEGFDIKVTPFSIPIGAEGDFKGVIDLIKGKAYLHNDGLDKPATEGDIPADMADDAEAARMELIETAAEADEALMEKYFENETLTPEEMKEGLSKGIIAGDVVPVFAGDAFDNAGVKTLLDTIATYFPSPDDRAAAVGLKPDSEDEVTRKPKADAPFSAYVFKTSIDQFAGRLNFIRVYSGSVKAGDSVYDANAEENVKISSLLSINGKEQTAVNALSVGDIGAIVKADVVQTDHTVCDAKDKIIYPPTDYPQPVMSYAAFPKSKGDEDKLLSSLRKLTEEDAMFRISRNDETNQLIASGLGEQHLAVKKELMQSRFGVGVEFEIPKVAYRETIRATAEAQGRYKKQTGGRGQFGDAHLRLEPVPRGDGYEFVDAIVGGVIPSKFIPSVEKGVAEALHKGVLAGYPVVDLKCTVYYGSYHTVDSSDMAFQIAARMAFKDCMAAAKPVLLEPIMKVEIVVPDQFMGDINGDMASKRGRPLGMEPMGVFSKITATVPMAEMFRYSIDLRSMTGGQGSFSMEFDHYEEVPNEESKKIIAATKPEEEEEK
jgi:elongation factor G